MAYATLLGHRNVQPVASESDLINTNVLVMILQGLLQETFAS